ncbi:MAG: hypothetical protein ACR2M1_10420 [Gemmatimonadaceae bacterium]
MMTTIYRGIAFNSRMEAQWAVFLDALAVEWAYASKACLLANGRLYTTGFWMPQFDAFLDVIEPERFISEETAHAAEALTKMIYVAHGIPDGRMGDWIWDGPRSLEVFWPEEGWDDGHTFAVCPHGYLGIEFEGGHTIDRHCHGSNHMDTPQVVRVGLRERGRGDVDRAGVAAIQYAVDLSNDFRYGNAGVRR